LGLALAALGVFVAVEGGAVAGGQTYARVGPEVFPRLVGAGLALVGVLLALDAWRCRWSAAWAAPVSATGSRRDVLRLLGRVLLMAFGLVLSAALMQPAGFIAATTTLFLCVTIAFGSRVPIRDLAIGLVFTTAVFLIFTMGLGLSLPRGQLWSP
jgi:putative tricarboxylic transport membrane protein